MAKIKVEESKPMQPDMTPMIDCVFQLIIFFICSIRFKQVEGKLLSWMPKTRGPQPSDSMPAPDIEEVKVRIDFKNGTPIYYLKNSRIDDLDRLVTEVAYNLDLVVLAGKKDPTVILTPFSYVPLQPVIDVLSRFQKEKFVPEFALLERPIR